MAVQVYSNLFTGGIKNFEAHTWQIDGEGYLSLLLADGDRLAEFPPGRWSLVLDMDPAITK